MFRPLPRKARRYLWAPVVLVAAIAAVQASPALAAADTMTVNFSLYGRAPTYRASGFIYGISTNASSPSTSMTDQIKVKTMRAGGSTGIQTSCECECARLAPPSLPSLISACR